MTSLKIKQLVSWALLLKGSIGLIFAVLETFRFTQAVTSTAMIDEREFLDVLRKFLVEGVSSTVEAGYGLFMLTTKAHLKFLHYALSAILFFLPLFINDSFLRQIQRFIPQVGAQETSYDQAISDYQFSLQKYRDSHQQYLVAKNTYLTFLTLNSKTEAITTTKNLLIARTTVLRTHLFALRINLRQTPNVTNTATLEKRLATEEAYLANHEQQLQTIVSLEDTTRLSQELENKYPSLQLLAYQALYAILQGQQTDISLTLTSVTNNLNALPVNLPIASQWLTDTLTVLDNHRTSLADTQKLLDKFTAQKSSLLTNQRNFAKILNQLDGGRDQLLQASGYLTEFINLVSYE